MVKKVTKAGKKTKTPVNRVTVNSSNVLEEVMGLISKDYSFASVNEEEKTNYLPTGNSAIDFVLTNKLTGGGWPIGKITELSGNNATGKSLLGLLALISTMNGAIKDEDGNPQPGISVLIDTERAYNAEFFELLGGDHSKLVLATPETAEEVYDFVKNFIEITRKKTDVPITFVFDSLAGTPTASELERGISSGERMGMRGMIHGRGIRLIKDLIADENITFIVINQLRKTFAMYGDPEDTVGGEAMKYHASMRCRLKKGYKISTKKGKVEAGAKGVNLRDIVGIQGRFVIQKSRFTRPFREVTFDIFYRGGLSPVSGLYDVLTDFYKDTNGTIEPSTEWTGNKPGHWKYNVDAETVIPFKKSNFEAMLRENLHLIAPYNFEIVDHVLPIDEVEVENGIDDQIKNGDDIDDDDLANLIAQPLEDEEE